MFPRVLPFLAFAVATSPLVAQVPTAAPAPAALLDSAATIELGRRYTEWFYADLGDSLIAHSSAQVREKITADALSEFMGQLVSQAGNEVSVIEERVRAKDSLSAYLREAQFEMIDEPLVVAFTLGRNGDIYGFFIRPKSQVPAEPAN